jgi:hypothetical protein
MKMKNWQLFLTNKKQAIPILIVVDKETGSVLGNWGPRPKAAANLVADYKKRIWCYWWNLKTNLQLCICTIKELVLKMK